MTRTYTQRRRADAQDARRQQMIDALFTLWRSGGFDAVTLQAVADTAGVSLKTVVRHFGSKEELLGAAMGSSIAREEAGREVPPGDVAAVVEVLCGRYELFADRLVRESDIEFRYPVMAEWIAGARQSHLAWLARAFAPWLPAEGAVRDTRLMALFWATEMRAWWAVRFAFHHPADATAAVMRGTLDALVRSWTPP